MAPSFRRPHFSKSLSKPHNNAKKSAIAGYAARHARKPASKADLGDVYEFSTEKRDIKRLRSGVEMDLTKDEALEFGQGGDEENDEDNEEEGMDRKMARLMEEGDILDSADDEELDSDQAWGSSDDETFAGYGFKPKNKPKKKNVCGKLPCITLRFSH